MNFIQLPRKQRKILVGYYSLPHPVLMCEVITSLITKAYAVHTTHLMLQS